MPNSTSPRVINSRPPPAYSQEAEELSQKLERLNAITFSYSGTPSEVYQKVVKELGLEEFFSQNNQPVQEVHSAAEFDWRAYCKPGTASPPMSPKSQKFLELMKADPNDSLHPDANSTEDLVNAVWAMLPPGCEHWRYSANDASLFMTLLRQAMPEDPNWRFDGSFESIYDWARQHNMHVEF
ncbi:hypothetical protein ONZ45_g17355 [Pleurotus djamor]|nr:hypothetical protein ONZ45_g17355 [Pleurotus djamor]